MARWAVRGRRPLPRGPVPDGDAPRLVLARRIRAMRDEGMKHSEIAEALGYSRTHVASVDLDPEGARERARKDRYRGECVDCGRPTDGSNGFKGTPLRCRHCAPRAEMVWTREAIIDALRDFHNQHGRVPTAGELGGGGAAQRVERVDWLPWYTILRDRFGSAREAMRAAGFEPNRSGYYARPSQVIRRVR